MKRSAVCARVCTCVHEMERQEEVDCILSVHVLQLKETSTHTHIAKARHNLHSELTLADCFSSTEGTRRFFTTELKTSSQEAPAPEANTFANLHQDAFSFV